MWKITANVLTFCVMVYLNYLANALPINGKTTGQLSAQYPNLFVPAGITFSIWGIIYLLLFLFVIWQFWTISRPVVTAIGWAFAISSILNALWIVAWHYEFPGLSLLIMIGLLASLVFINYNLPEKNSALAKASFGIYLGWICVATIANTTAYLVSINWGGWGVPEVVWTIAMILIGTAIVGFALVKLQNPFIGIAVVWAFAGIVLNRWESHQEIVITAFFAITVVAALTIFKFYRLSTVTGS